MPTPTPTLGGSHTGLAERYLISVLTRLTTDVEDRWYNETPADGANRTAEGTPRVFGLIRWITGTPVELIAPGKQGSAQRYIVEVLKVGASFEELNEIYELVDGALYGSQGSIPGKPGYEATVTFNSDWKQRTVRDGVSLSRLGGEYTVHIEKL